MSTWIMVHGEPKKRDGKCHDTHDDYTCTFEFGHPGQHGTWRLGIGAINWTIK